MKTNLVLAALAAVGFMGGTRATITTGAIGDPSLPIICRETDNGGMLSNVKSTLSPAAAATSIPAAIDRSQSGTVYTGDITHYDVAMGSCGYTNSNSDWVVALPPQIMQNGPNPNSNPLCGQYITISYQGNTHQAEIVDTCMGCTGDSIDLSPTLFTAVAPDGNGRVSGVQWWFDTPRAADTNIKRDDACKCPHHAQCCNINDQAVCVEDIVDCEPFVASSTVTGSITTTIYDEQSQTLETTIVPAASPTDEPDCDSNGSCSMPSDCTVSFPGYVSCGSTTATAAPASVLHAVQRQDIGTLLSAIQSIAAAEASTTVPLVGVYTATNTLTPAKRQDWNFISALESIASAAAAAAAAASATSTGYLPQPTEIDASPPPRREETSGYLPQPSDIVVFPPKKEKRQDGTSSAYLPQPSDIVVFPPKKRGDDTSTDYLPQPSDIVVFPPKKEKRQDPSSGYLPQSSDIVDFPPRKRQDDGYLPQPSDIVFFPPKKRQVDLPTGDPAEAASLMSIASGFLTFTNDPPHKRQVGTSAASSSGYQAKTVVSTLITVVTTPVSAAGHYASYNGSGINPGSGTVGPYCGSALCPELTSAGAGEGHPWGPSTTPSQSGPHCDSALCPDGFATDTGEQTTGGPSTVMTSGGTYSPSAPSTSVTTTTTTQTTSTTSTVVKASAPSVTTIYNDPLMPSGGTFPVWQLTNTHRNNTSSCSDTYIDISTFSASLSISSSTNTGPSSTGVSKSVNTGAQSTHEGTSAVSSSAPSTTVHTSTTTTIGDAAAAGFSGAITSDISHAQTSNNIFPADNGGASNEASGSRYAVGAAVAMGAVFAAALML